MARSPKLLALGLIALALAGTATSAFANSNPYARNGGYGSYHRGYPAYYHHHRWAGYHHHHQYWR